MLFSLLFFASTAVKKGICVRLQKHCDTLQTYINFELKLRTFAGFFPCSLICLSKDDLKCSKCHVKENNLWFAPPVCTLLILFTHTFLGLTDANG